MIMRKWATPLVIGSSVVMAVTGLLIFFRLDSGYNKVVHEWIGWAMVVGIITHGLVNLKPLLNYVRKSLMGQLIIGVFLLVLALSFLPQGEREGGGGSPFVIAFTALTKAPLTQIAPLAGRSVEDVQRVLDEAGLPVADPASSLDAAYGHDRRKMVQAIRLLWAGSGGKGSLGRR